MKCEILYFKQITLAYNLRNSLCMTSHWRFLSIYFTLTCFVCNVDRTVTCKVLNTDIISEKYVLCHVLCLNTKIGKKYSDDFIGCAVTFSASVPIENGVSTLVTSTVTDMNKKFYFTSLKFILL